jgi:hypothetical protein
VRSLEYLTDKEKRSKIKEIVEHEEGIAMASEVLMTISKDEIEQARLMSEFKYQVDLQSHLAYAEQKGEEMGIKKGLAKGRENERKYVLELVAQGLSLDEIKQRLIQPSNG